MQAYAPQARLSDLDDTTTGVPRLVLGVLLIEVMWWLGGGAAFALLSPAGGSTDIPAGAAIASLFSYGIIWIGVGLVLRRLQHRGWLSLIGPFGEAFADFRAVIRWSGGLMLGLSLWAVLPFLDQTVSSRPLPLWALTLPLALAATFVQTTAEELYFRGYMQSTLAARFSNPLIWMVLPSVVFGLVHLPNASTGPQIVEVVLYTGLFGLCAADLTARTGTLGAAIAFHFMHNAVLFTLYANAGMLESNVALWVFADPATLGPEAGGPSGAFDVTFYFQLSYLLVSLLLLWLAARVAVRR